MAKEIAKYLRLASQSTPEWVRLLLALLVGGIAAAAGGAIDAGSDRPRLLLGLAGIMAGSLTAFITARSISELNDRRSTRRKLHAALASFEMLRICFTALQKELEPLDEEGPVDDERVDGIAAGLLGLSLVAGKAADFAELLDDDRDRLVAQEASAVYLTYQIHDFSKSLEWDRETLRRKISSAQAHFAEGRLAVQGQEIEKVIGHLKDRIAAL